MGDMHSVSSFSGVPADEGHRGMPDNYSPMVYSLAEGVPAKESSWEYDLDRENSNAAALLLCHTATPKLSLYPRSTRSGAPVDFSTAAHDASGKNTVQNTMQMQGASQNTNTNEPAEDVSLTWKLLGAADNVVQFFSSMAPIQENFNRRQTLPNPKRVHPNVLFERKQQDLMQQAAHTLRDAVKKLIAASGTTNAEMATMRLPMEIRSRFTRLRIRLAEALRSGGEQSSNVNGMASDLERFVSMCNYLAQTDPSKVDPDLRQEFVNFSQRHAQDLESHCRTFRWQEEGAYRGSDGGGASGLVRGTVTRPPPSGSVSSVRPPPSAAGRPLSSGMGVVREHYAPPAGGARPLYSRQTLR
jgi:hypothetical protein